MHTLWKITRNTYLYKVIAKRGGRGGELVRLRPICLEKMSG